MKPVLSPVTCQQVQTRNKIYEVRRDLADHNKRSKMTHQSFIQRLVLRQHLSAGGGKDWILEQRSSLILILLIISLGLVLRLLHLTEHAFWIDEAVTHIAARRDFAGLMDAIRTVDGNPPAYLIFMRSWVRVFGFDEAPLRIPSMMFGVLTIGVIYASAYRLYNRNIALLSALILAFSSFHVWYAQEARAYAMTGFLIALSFYFFVRLKDEDNWTILFAYWFCSVLMLYTHYFAWFFLLAQNAYVLYLLATHQSSGALKIKPWAGLQLGIIAAFLPWVPSFLDQIKVGHGDWIKAPSWTSTYELWRGFSGSGFVLSLYVVLLLASVSLFFLNRSQPKGEGKSDNKLISHQTLLLIIWVAVPILISLVLSFLWRPILYPRYVIGASFPFYILIALCVFRLSLNRTMHVVLLAVLVLAGVQQMYGYYRYDWNHWRLENDWNREGGPKTVLIFCEIPKNDLVICPGGCGAFAEKWLGDVSGHMAEPKPLLKEANSLYRRENDFKTLLESKNGVLLVEENGGDREKRAQAILEQDFDLVDYFEFWPNRIFVYRRRPSTN